MFESSPEIIRDKVNYFGVKLETLDDDIFRAIVGIYYEVVLNKVIEESELEHNYFVSDIDSMRGVEYRLGSTLNSHSKLYAIPEGEEKIVEFTFYPNHQRQEYEYPDSDEYHKALAIGEKFAERVDQLLLALGVAEPTHS